MRDENRGERAITLEDLYGWLNANEGGDFNKLREHGGADSWSGVFTSVPAARQATLADSDSDSDSDSENAYGVGTWLTMPRARGIDERGGGAVFSTRRGKGPPLPRRRTSRGGSNGWARRRRAGGEGRGHADRAAVRMLNEDSLANDKKVAERRGEVGK